ncbi:hypothetical protein OIY81_2815 [Cryptosporidium canis]|nr:hypothetical protein OIY81_2815 [Cryptosporidium canis]
MGQSGSTSAENCGVRKVNLRCTAGTRESTSTRSGVAGRVVSFYDDLNEYLDIEFLAEDVEEFVGSPEQEGELRRGKSHDVSLVSVLRENLRKESRPELLRSETYNIGSGAFGCECGGSSKEAQVRTLRSFLNPQTCIRIPEVRRRLSDGEVVGPGKVTLGGDELIETAMRYICDTEKNVALPLFPSSLYTSNITCNSWYSLTGFLENRISFEVPEGVEAISLMGYSFSVEDADVRRSSNLHSLSFLENLRLVLREKRTAEFTILKPQVWFKRTEESLIQLEENNLTKRSLSSSSRGVSDDQDRFYSQGVIYCSVLKGMVNIVESKQGLELWWSFEGSASDISNEAIKLPLVDSLDVGVSKLEDWLLNETVNNPESWIPFYVPQKKLGNSTSIWVHRLEKLLLNAQIFWRCQYLMKSLNTYNSCLLALAGTNSAEEDYKSGASTILSKFINGDHITIYTVCFSELISQFESWRINHRITNGYCTEMMSLMCVNCLVTSESLLETMLGLKETGFELEFAVSPREESLLADSRGPLETRFTSFLSKILVLRGLSLRSLLNYQTREFIIQHLRTKIQSLQICESERVNVRESFGRILSIFEQDQVFEKTTQTFITGLSLIAPLIPRRNDFLVVEETIMSAVLFFAEVDRNITLARMIGEKLLEGRLNALGGGVVEQVSWEDLSNVKCILSCGDVSGPAEVLSYRLEEDLPTFEAYSERMIRGNYFLLNQRLERVFESLQIRVHILRVRLSPAFINFLLPRAVDEVRDELYSLRRGAFRVAQDNKENSGGVIFENCCQSNGYTDSGNSNYMQEIDTFRHELDQDQRRILGKEQGPQKLSSLPQEGSPKPEPSRASLPSVIFSVARSLVTREKGVGFAGIQCCNTDRTDFRNLLDLADSNCGGGTYSAPTWSVSEGGGSASSDKSQSTVSQKKADRLEELIFDWIKLRCWNFTDSDLRWIDGCNYVGNGEFETAFMQISPEFNIESMAKRILQEVDHSEVRQSLRHITFEENSPLILVRGHILPYGELLLPSPHISQLISAVRSCNYR